jgi:hypothetical protein
MKNKCNINVIYQWAIRTEMRLAKNKLEIFLNIPLNNYIFLIYIITNFQKNNKI